MLGTPPDQERHMAARHFTIFRYMKEANLKHFVRKSCAFKLAEPVIHVQRCCKVWAQTRAAGRPSTVNDTKVAVPQAYNPRGKRMTFRGSIYSAFSAQVYESQYRAFDAFLAVQAILEPYASPRRVGLAPPGDWKPPDPERGRATTASRPASHTSILPQHTCLCDTSKY